MGRFSGRRIFAGERQLHIGVSKDIVPPSLLWAKVWGRIQRNLRDALHFLLKPNGKSLRN
jgi:hypothetical protein